MVPIHDALESSRFLPVAKWIVTRCATCKRNEQRQHCSQKYAERDIAAIFQQVLGLDQISVFDNFFDVGADSINLITINNRLNKAPNQNISTTVMFEHTSIAQLAQYLNPDEERQKQQQQDEPRASLMRAKN